MPKIIYDRKQILSKKGNQVTFKYLTVWIHKWEKFKPLVFHSNNPNYANILRVGFITVRWDVSTTDFYEYIK